MRPESGVVRGSRRAGIVLSACLLFSACGGDTTGSATAPGSEAPVGSIQRTAEASSPGGTPGSPGPGASSQGPGGSSVAVPTPSAEASPQVYVVKRGDTLLLIAQMFDLTVEQLLAANPQITDPDRIEAGDELLIAAIPPADLPPPRAAEVSDPARDLSDPDEQATLGPRYTDILALRASTEATDLVLELTLGGHPPKVDPRDESLRYSLFLDGLDEGTAIDYRVILENSGDGFALAGRLATGAGDGAGAGGSPLPTEAILVAGGTVTIRIPLADLGSPQRIGVICLAERSFVADPAQPDAAQESLDRLPDGEWLASTASTLPPLTRWVRITTGS